MFTGTFHDWSLVLYGTKTAAQPGDPRNLGHPVVAVTPATDTNQVCLANNPGSTVNLVGK